MLSRNLWVRYQSFAHLAAARNTRPQKWLSEAELRELERYRHANRRDQWLAGRFMAKQLLADQLLPWQTDWREVEILSRDAEGRAVRPQVRVAKAMQPWCLSISHSDRGALVAVSLQKDIIVGVDLAEVEEVKPEALVFWFSAREREWLRGGTPKQAAICWAIKEACYKAINQGESFVPRKFEVFLQDGNTYDCHYNGDTLRAKSRISIWEVENQIAVTAMLSDSPVALETIPQTGSRQPARVEFAESPFETIGVS